VIGITEEMMKLTLSIITRTMFGEEISEQRKQQVADAVNVTIARSAQLLYSPIQMPFFVPTKGNRMHREALQTLDQLVDEILDRLEQDTQKYENTLIGLLYAVRDQAGQPLPRSEIRDQMVTMLIAGHETTANALSWAWYALSHHPQQIQAIRDELAELKQMLQASAGHDVDSIERYKALRYTQAVVQETLRLYPPAWLILREAQEDVEILGETFVKGSSMLISPYALHRNEQVFTDPLSFRPERFLSGQQYPRFTYFPFGGGSRSCIGSTFALMEATLVLAEMVQRLHLESDPQTTPTPETSVSLRMKQELPMTVRMWS
jgi:cytochrome P450